MRSLFITILFAVPAITIAGDISFHGYGELHYNAPDTGDKELDLHRFVIGMRYDFNSQWSFDMELDFEHSFSEPEFEFMHLDYAHSDLVSFRSGLILMPMGPLNQTHEPPLFFSVERPYVQKNIIPTTWQAPGVGIFGSFGEGFEYQSYIVTAMEAKGTDGSKGVRGWRSKGVESVANDLAYMGRLQWNGLGVQFGGSLYFGEVDQQEEGDLSARMTLWDLDFHYQRAGFDVRGVYASSSISGAEDLNTILGLEGDKSVGEDMFGYYVTAGYDVLNGRSEKRLVPFVRIEKYDTQDGVPAGFENNASTEKELTTFGLTYFPTDRIAVKADFENWKDGTDVFNLGVGYHY